MARVPRKLTSTLLSTAWGWLGWKALPKKQKSSVCTALKPLPGATDAGVCHERFRKAQPSGTFSVEDVLKRGRRTNRSSAGGLSGSNYKAMQAWFFAADTLAEQLTELFNRIAAGQVPASIVPLLT